MCRNFVGQVYPVVQEFTSANPMGVAPLNLDLNLDFLHPLHDRRIPLGRIVWKLNWESSLSLASTSFHQRGGSHVTRIYISSNATVAPANDNLPSGKN
ncbi:hypothetical protein HYDPIDRAFT_110305 [Hydnomerulius pinastri MD-312]|nr:hypothetical protein HYDPIDRAFT_110305 [Hydnomerulius pinastri MD-312]